jgi:hypothetical protein
MYLDGLSFLEDEREAWRPYEALAELSDEQLLQPVEGAHGWTGRELMAHLAIWHGVALAMAKEYALGPESPTHERMRAEWDAGGDALNERLLAEWRDVPLAEIRRRFRETPGEVRGYLTAAPEARWLKNSRNMEYIYDCTLGHCKEHAVDLRAVLAAAGR